MNLVYPIIFYINSNCLENKLKSILKNFLRKFLKILKIVWYKFIYFLCNHLMIMGNILLF
jgi:hypothetical protein